MTTVTGVIDPRCTCIWAGDPIYRPKCPVHEPEHPTCASLRVELREAYQIIYGLFNDEPDKSGQYFHLAICSGDRRFPLGERGHSCCCANSPLFKRLTDAPRARVAVLEKVAEAAGNVIESSKPYKEGGLPLREKIPAWTKAMDECRAALDAAKEG